MHPLHLETKTKEQELIKAYLQENAGDVLAEKINNGVIIEKDGKRLVNRKNLDGFMQYACGEARKQAEQGRNSACIQDSVVFGWAIHYFEENSIEGTLYNEDGTEYKPASAPKQAVSSKPLTPPNPQPKPQLSFFDLMNEQEKSAEPVKIQPVSEPEQPTENIDDDDEISEDEQREILTELAAEEERRAKEPRQQPAGSPIYRQYLDIQTKYPDSIVAYRLGDFYEIFGENAVRLAEELDLTLTARDCGPDEHVPVVGFPVYAADNYFKRLLACGYKLAICETSDDVRYMRKVKNDIIDSDTGEVLAFGNGNPLTSPPVDPDPEKAFEPAAIRRLSDLLGDSFILR